MKIVLFDLETTGIPLRPDFINYYSYNNTKFYDNARVIQIAMQIYENTKLQKEFNFMIKPDNFSIKNSHIHGITDDIANSTGIDFIDAINKIFDDVKDANLLVSHNIAFDINVLFAEMYRYKLINEIKIMEKIKTFCTSLGGIEITKIPSAHNNPKRNKYKQPKLIELYKFLFKKECIQTHDALADTKILADCFFEMIGKKYIDIQKIF
jgi:DNA polymerase III epsilon subunit-like protein